MQTYYTAVHALGIDFDTTSQFLVGNSVCLFSVYDAAHHDASVLLLRHSNGLSDKAGLRGHKMKRNTG